VLARTAENDYSSYQVAGNVGEGEPAYAMPAGEEEDFGGFGDGYIDVTTTVESAYSTLGSNSGGGGGAESGGIYNTLQRGGAGAGAGNTISPDGGAGYEYSTVAPVGGAGGGGYEYATLKVDANA